MIGFVADFRDDLSDLWPVSSIEANVSHCVSAANIGRGRLLVSTRLDNRKLVFMTERVRMFSDAPIGSPNSFVPGSSEPSYSGLFFSSSCFSVAPVFQYVDSKQLWKEAQAGI